MARTITVTVRNRLAVIVMQRERAGSLAIICEFTGTGLTGIVGEPVTPVVEGINEERKRDID